MWDFIKNGDRIKIDLGRTRQCYEV